VSGRKQEVPQDLPQKLNDPQMRAIEPLRLSLPRVGDRRKPVIDQLVLAGDARHTWSLLFDVYASL